MKCFCKYIVFAFLKYYTIAFDKKYPFIKYHSHITSFVKIKILPYVRQAANVYKQPFRSQYLHTSDVLFELLSTLNDADHLQLTTTFCL